MISNLFQRKPLRHQATGTGVTKRVWPAARNLDSERVQTGADQVVEGFSLKEIGDHLGHRSAEATRTYAKVDLVGLRQVANFDLRGLR